MESLKNLENHPLKLLRPSLIMSQGRKKQMAQPGLNPGTLAYHASTLTTELPSHTVDLWQLQYLFRVNHQNWMGNHCPATCNVGNWTSVLRQQATILILCYPGPIIQWLFSYSQSYHIFSCFETDNDLFDFTNWAASSQNQQCGCAPSEDSDQPGHLPSLIRVFAVRSMVS